ncbi:hypothetical protein Dvina_50525 [Dactylosporangium vinaceum]|uniref:DUF3558 domain-containing protein n=1 Tax=Dactylosporangium vinaceum TaxID=53362 RepID=A0ABV5M4R7_9ACTN|nr:hypothetical protein [Dactylosporangium vinaceum]UAB96100.1 hypothetical protein Dvina_50525 [Dactylosporangium vinaceum]
MTTTLSGDTVLVGGDRAGRRRLRKLLLLASATLVLAGCGDDKAAAPPDAKSNAAAYDSVDVCSLAGDDQYKAALGEAAAGKERRDTDSLKACAVDGSSGAFYIFLSVMRPSMGAGEQVSFDKAAVQGAKDVDANTFSFFDDGQAYVETSDGALVLRASFVYYVDSGKITDGPGVVNRLHTLLGQMTQKV